ncbi:MAG: hypothetical protein ACI81L_003632 [Verrucomicrobiales bacterium]|jgi:hypothetical protein
MSATIGFRNCLMRELDDVSERRSSMKLSICVRRFALAVGLCLVATGCTSSDPALDADVVDSSSAIVPDEPANRPDRTAIDRPGDEPETEREPRADPGLNDTDDLMRVPGALRWETAITGGRRITISFVGGAVGNYESPCAWDYRLETEQDDELVQVFLGATRILRPGAHVRDCPSATTNWAITTTLAETLGNRHLRDGETAQLHRPIQIETRLVPTWLPEEWVGIFDDRSLPQQIATYGRSDATGQPRIEVLTTPISVRPRLSDLRTLTGWEPTTIRRVDDGVLFVGDNRETTLGFEEQGWYYLIVAQPDVDPSVVLEFARSFERPALFEGDLSSAFTDVVRTVPPQPGQEEREATR